MKHLFLSCLLIILAGKGLCKICNVGVRPHKSNVKDYQKFENCGITDNVKDAECKKDMKSCAVVDVWITGIEEKPLTIHHCKEQLTKEEMEGKCDPSCEKKRIENFKPNLKKWLKKHATTGSKLTDECLNWMMSIDAIAKAQCSGGDKCADRWCAGSTTINAVKECRSKGNGTTHKSNHTGVTVTTDAKGNGASHQSDQTDIATTNKPSKETSNVKGNEASHESDHIDITAATKLSDKTGDATISGKRRKMNEMINVTYFAFLFFMKIFF